MLISLSVRVNEHSQVRSENCTYYISNFNTNHISVSAVFLVLDSNQLNLSPVPRPFTGGESWSTCGCDDSYTVLYRDKLSFVVPRQQSKTRRMNPAVCVCVCVAN